MSKKEELSKKMEKLLQKSTKPFVINNSSILTDKTKSVKLKPKQK